MWLYYKKIETCVIWNNADMCECVMCDMYDGLLLDVEYVDVNLSVGFTLYLETRWLELVRYRWREWKIETFRYIRFIIK